MILFIAKDNGSHSLSREGFKDMGKTSFTIFHVQFFDVILNIWLRFIKINVGKIVVY